MNDLSRARSGAGRLLLGGVAALFLASLSVGASAGVAYQTPAYTGVASGIYKGPAPVASGAINTSAVLNVAGRQITVPASARVAANAAIYATSLYRLTPLALGVAGAAWLLTYGLEPYEGQITVKPILYDLLNLTTAQAQVLIDTLATLTYPSALTTCTSWGIDYWVYQQSRSGVPNYWGLYCGTMGNPYYPSGTNYLYKEWPEPTQPAAPSEPRRVATDTDFDAPNASPLPDSVADELADNQGVPVATPQVSPADIATGSPYAKPDGTWAQPRARITPMPDGSVAISPYEVPVAAPDGTPQPQPDYIPEGEPVASGTETQPDPCDLHPDRAGCVSLGEPVDQPVSKTTQALSITPESVSMPGSCPAPKQVVTPFGTIELSYDPACQFATTIRPVVLALGMFMSAMIFVGGLRNG